MYDRYYYHIVAEEYFELLYVDDVSMCLTPNFFLTIINGILS